MEYMDRMAGHIKGCDGRIVLPIPSRFYELYCSRRKSSFGESNLFLEMQLQPVREVILRQASLLHDVGLLYANLHPNASSSACK